MEILAKILYDGVTVHENVRICFDEQTITDIIPHEKEIGSVYVTPAFIDPHSHIGLDRQAEPYAENEANDGTGQIQPLLDPLNSVYFDDTAFVDAVNWGVLYSCIVPGSGNILGGKAVIIKNFAQSRKEALVKYYGYKMALGFNPRLIGSSEEWKGERPNTRMGVYSLLEAKFDDLIRRRKTAELERDKAILDDKGGEKIDLINDEYDLAFSGEDKAILELLDGKAIAKVHVHKADDIYYLIDLARKYNLKVSIEHLNDVNREDVFRDVYNSGMKIVYGPLGSFDYKVELKNSSYQNTKFLMKSGAPFCLMSDHPVTLSYCLRDQLKYFLIQGMDKVKALSLVTSESAKILGLDNLGTIYPGKLASFVVWNSDPFDLAAVPIAVYAEGRALK